MPNTDTAAAPAPTASTAPMPHALSAPQQLFLILTAVYVTSLVMANVLGVKLFIYQVPWFGSTLDIKHTVGMLPFPITFLLTDLLNEYYGKRAARRVAYVAFSMAVFAFILISIARAMPILSGIPGTATQEAFENIFGAAAVMYIASVLAFLVGSVLDISLFGLFKRLTGGKLVWLRATGSTVVSQVFDSFIVTWLFFAGLPMLMNIVRAPDDRIALSGMKFVLETAATGYVLKFFIAVAMTPLIYAGRWAIQKFLGMKPLSAM